MRDILIAISLLLIILVSCNNGTMCYESTDTLMVASFSVKDTTIISCVITGVDRHDIGDTLANDQTRSPLKRATLPLALSADSTGFVIDVNGHTDTIYIKHTMILNFISADCGFAPNYTISGFRFTKGIDSVKIKDAKVNTTSKDKITNDQNISIYLNPGVH